MSDEKFTIEKIIELTNTLGIGVVIDSKMINHKNVRGTILQKLFLQVEIAQMKLTTYINSMKLLVNYEKGETDYTEEQIEQLKKELYNL